MMMGKLLGFLGLQEEETMEENMNMDQEDDIFPSRKQKNQTNNPNNLISIHSQRNIKVVLSEPRSYEETQEIADHLRSHRPTVVNLQRLSQDQARRVVDFLSGCVYALNGQIKKIGPAIFFCTPENIDIQGAITEMMKEEEI